MTYYTTRPRPGRLRVVHKTKTCPKLKHAGEVFRVKATDAQSNPRCRYCFPGDGE